MSAVRNFLLPLASAIMIACISMSLVALSYTFGSTWDTNYLVPLSALVAIESYFSIRTEQDVRVRIIELAVIYVVLEAVDALSNGGTIRQALTPHFNQPIMFGAILLLFVWLGVREMADMLPEIHKTIEPTSVVTALTLRFVAGGVLLFFVAGLTQRSLAGALQLSSHAPSGPLLNVLVYFLLGMLIVSYIQYEALHQRWALQETRVVGDLHLTWLRLTAALLVVALVIAALLPTTQVFGLTALISAIWRELSSMGLTVWNHLPGQTSTPPLSKIFGHPRHHPPHLRPPPKTPHGAGPPAWLNGARTAVFWLLLAGGVLYVLSRVRWAAVAEARPRGKRPSLLARFTRLWRRLWGRVHRSARRVAALVPRALPRRTAKPAAGRFRRLLRLNALSPEEQVRYFYLSLLRRAQEQGVQRIPSQTPREFAARLAPRVGDAEPDLDGLTDTFIEARYSGHGIEKERVTPVKAQWRRLRNALRARPT
jgi:hypothetical protein